MVKGRLSRPFISATINAPSKRVIEKCGFVYEGTLRDYFYMNGEYVGRLYFSILRNEFETME